MWGLSTESILKYLLNSLVLLSRTHVHVVEKIWKYCVFMRKIFAVEIPFFLRFILIFQKSNAFRGYVYFYAAKMCLVEIRCLWIHNQRRTHCEAL